MTSKDMQYDLIKKLGKVDSQAYRNILGPERDWALNEAEEIFIKMIAMPRLKNHLGFETSQRSIDDIRTIVEHDDVPTIGGYMTLPENYWHFLGADIEIEKGSCSSTARVHVRQHDDEFEDSPFDSSSFEWRTVNAIFTEDKMKFYTDGIFTLGDVNLRYIRKPAYIHNADDYVGGTYTLPDGTVLAGTQDCELPEHTHREIVDIAVLIITGEIESQAFQLKQAKLNLNKLN